MLVCFSSLLLSCSSSESRTLGSSISRFSSSSELKEAKLSSDSDSMAVDVLVSDFDLFKVTVQERAVKLLELAPKLENGLEMSSSEATSEF